jgi:hypothetical protein
MERATFQHGVEPATLAATIAHSPIVVPRRESGSRLSRLPAGFDAVDVAILDWIAAEGRRAGRSFLTM